MNTLYFYWQTIHIQTWLSWLGCVFVWVLCGFTVYFSHKTRAMSKDLIRTAEDFSAFATQWRAYAGFGFAVAHLLEHNHDEMMIVEMLRHMIASDTDLHRGPLQ